VDVDRGACEESGAKGQFSEHTQGKIHVPTVAEEPNLEVLGSTAVALGTESNALSFRWAMGGHLPCHSATKMSQEYEGVLQGFILPYIVCPYSCVSTCLVILLRR
jgi:hypothetical protein